jgi:hypothetical protein
MRRLLIYAAIVLTASLAVGREANSQIWDFEEVELGKLPAGWTAAKTGDGEGQGGGGRR